MYKLLTMFFTIASLLFTFDSHANIPGGRIQQTPEVVKAATYGYIDARGLKSVIDSGIPVTILDAREYWDDGYLIQGAYQASASSSPEYLNQLIPNSNELIVVYCYSYACPLSENLANKLLNLGYTNIMEYAGGLKEWRDVAKYPVDKIQ